MPTQFCPQLERLVAEWLHSPYARDIHMTDAPLNQILQSIEPLQANGLRRSVLDWRDHWITELEIQLVRDSRSLIADLRFQHSKVPAHAKIPPFKQLMYKEALDALKEIVTNVVDLWLKELDRRLPAAAKRELILLMRSHNISGLADRVELDFGTHLSILNLDSATELSHVVHTDNWEKSIIDVCLTGQDAILPILRKQIETVARALNCRF